MKSAVAAALYVTGVSLTIFAACASSDDEVGGDIDAGETPETSTPEPIDAGGADADAGNDAEALRCSGEFCLVDLPNPATYGFTRWMLRGVQVDPVIGAWAIANGVPGVDKSTAQLLHYEDHAWKAVYAPSLGSGNGRRSVELLSIATDGAGELLAVGLTNDGGDDEDDFEGDDRHPTPVLVRGNGTTFTTTQLEREFWGVWFAAPGQAWAVGPDDAIFRSGPDGSWISESTAERNKYLSVWGNGPGDVYVGGVAPDYGYGVFGHRTVDEAGAPQWTFTSLENAQRWMGFEYIVLAGTSPPGGFRLCATPPVLAREIPDGGEDGGPLWVKDPFQPKLPIRAFWARSKDDVWAAAHIGRLFHFDGKEWKDARLVFNGAPLTSHLLGVAGTSAGEIFVVGDGVALRREAK